MIAANAIKRLEKAGWEVETVNGTVYASKDNYHNIHFNTFQGKTNGGFHYESESFCTPIHYNSLKKAMDMGE